MSGSPATDTRGRVLGAATTLFASKGFRATTIRDIASRARVNVASGHYHFGSKKTLYLAVLREQFATIRQALAVRGGRTTTDSRLSRRALEERFRTRVQAMLDLQIGAAAVPHPALFNREMADPTEAVPIIVREFLAPLMADMASVLAQLAPTASPQTIERCCLSVAGQAHFYFTTRPALLHMWGMRAYPAHLTRDLAEHITAFSLGGLDAIEREARRRHRVAR